MTLTHERKLLIVKTIYFNILKFLLGSKFDTLIFQPLQYIDACFCFLLTVTKDVNRGA